MADTWDISSSPIVPFRKALSTREPVCRIFHIAGGERVPTRPFLFPIARHNPELALLHSPSSVPATTSDVHAYIVRNALVGGFGSQVFLDGKVVFGEDAYPYYVIEYVKQEISRWHWEIEKKVLEKSMIRIKSGYVISHFNPIYGHWLLEILPKLFAIKDLVARGLSAPVILPSGYCIPELLKEAVRLILPDMKIIEYDWLNQNIQIDRAIMPGMLNRGYIFSQYFRDVLDIFLAPFRSNPGPRNIFVSRSGLEGKFRRLGNIEALDELARRMGFTIVRPETMPWTAQLRMFASATLVAGEYGSGLHNTIFSPPGTKTICLNVVNEIQSRIANSFGQDVGYIFPTGGDPVKLEHHWDVQKVYDVDLQEFESRTSMFM